MVGMQFNEGEKVSYGGAVSRGAVRALGEDGGEVALLLGWRRKAQAAASLESSGQWCGLGIGCTARAAASFMLEIVLPWGLERTLELPPSHGSIQFRC